MTDPNSNPHSPWVENIRFNSFIDRDNAEAYVWKLIDVVTAARRVLQYSTIPTEQFRVELETALANLDKK
jgi:hypothetical protein